MKIECLTDTQMDCIIHALGLSKQGNGKRRRWAFRNFYIAANKSFVADAWRALEVKGCAISKAHGNDTTRYILTDKVYDLLPNDIRKRISLRVLMASNGEVPTGVYIEAL